MRQKVHQARECEARWRVLGPKLRVGVDRLKAGAGCDFRSRVAGLIGVIHWLDPESRGGSSEIGGGSPRGRRRRSWQRSCAGTKRSAETRNQPGVSGSEAMWHPNRQTRCARNRGNRARLLIGAEWFFRNRKGQVRRLAHHHQRREKPHPTR